MSLDSYVFRERPMPKGSPLFFALHGTGGDENQFFALAEQIWPHAGVISPRGDVSEYGAARFFRRKAEGVYDLEDLERRRRTMAGFVRSHKERAAPSRTTRRPWPASSGLELATEPAPVSTSDTVLVMLALSGGTPSASSTG